MRGIVSKVGVREASVCYRELLTKFPKFVEWQRQTQEECLRDEIVKRVRGRHQDDAFLATPRVVDKFIREGFAGE